MKLDAITVCYGEQTVLQAFSAQIEERGCVCIMGRNGSGKTTLLRVLAGLTVPQSGEVQDPISPVAYLFQEDRLLPWLSAMENLLFFAGKERRAEAEKWLNRFGLDTKDRRALAQYSGGMRQRAALALAFCAQSRLLLLDEPLQGLDAQYAAILRQAISEQKLEKSVVLVTHDEALASDVADQRILL